MAQKTVKKVAAKKPAAKKTVVKKAAAKKPVAKKVVAAPAETVVVASAAPCTHECGCGCKCHGGFGRFVRKLLLALIIFILGFVAANMICGNGPRGMRGPRVEYVNGCVDMASVKCPELLQALPAMDADNDGCITKSEYKAGKRELRRAMRSERKMHRGDRN